MTKKDTFNYITLDHAAKHLFFQVPKGLMYDEKYRDLKPNAKLLYAMLRERAYASVTNPKYIDDNGRAFVVSVVEEVEMFLNCSRGTANTTIKELEKANLLRKEHHKGDKGGKANRFYIAELTTDKNTILQMMKQQSLLVRAKSDIRSEKEKIRREKVRLEKKLKAQKLKLAWSKNYTMPGNTSVEHDENNPQNNPQGYQQDYPQDFNSISDENLEKPLDTSDSNHGTNFRPCMVQNLDPIDTNLLEIKNTVCMYDENGQKKNIDLEDWTPNEREMHILKMYNNIIGKVSNSHGALYLHIKDLVMSLSGLSIDLVTEILVQASEKIHPMAYVKKLVKHCYDGAIYDLDAYQSDREIFFDRISKGEIDNNGTRGNYGQTKLVTTEPTKPMTKSKKEEVKKELQDKLDGEPQVE
ncbi:replication initiator protein A [Clostridium sp.]|uniref:replication initiator protein A n=1 Tax=Clostridium sp. TaxID=1506 RepID=UPI002FC8F004